MFSADVNETCAAHLNVGRAVAQQRVGLDPRSTDHPALAWPARDHGEHAGDASGREQIAMDFIGRHVTRTLHDQAHLRLMRIEGRSSASVPASFHAALTRSSTRFFARGTR